MATMLLTVLKVALIAFIVAGLASITVSVVLRSRRTKPDLSEAYEAECGAPMAGNWTRPIEDNNLIIAEDPDWPGRLGPPR
jgi:NADH:ubiquinone oxidoreductase subunit 3 (subunit A)